MILMWPSFYGPPLLFLNFIFLKNRPLNSSLFFVRLLPGSQIIESIGHPDDRAEVHFKHQL